MTAGTLSWPFSLSFTVYLFTWTSDLVGGNEEMSGIPRGLSKSLPISKSKSCSLETVPPVKHHLPHLSQRLTPCTASACLCAQLWPQGCDQRDPQHCRGQGVRGVPLSTEWCCFQRCLVLSVATPRGDLCCCTQYCWSAQEQLLRYESVGKRRAHPKWLLAQVENWGLHMGRAEEQREGELVLHISLMQLHFHASPATPGRQRGSVGCDPPHLQREVAVALHCGISPRQLPHSQGNPGEQELDFHHAP